jgi:hypothetical protein
MIMENLVCRTNSKVDVGLALLFIRQGISFPAALRNSDAQRGAMGTFPDLSVLRVFSGKP